MKNKNYSEPYANLSFGKTAAPKKKNEGEVKATKTVGKDLRVGGKR